VTFVLRRDLHDIIMFNRFGGTGEQQPPNITVTPGIPTNGVAATIPSTAAASKASRKSHQPPGGLPNKKAAG